MNNIYLWFSDKVWWYEFINIDYENIENKVKEYVKNNVVLASEADKKEAFSSDLFHVAEKFDIPLAMIKDDIKLLKILLKLESINNDEERQKWINLYPLAWNEERRYAKFIKDADEYNKKYWKDFFKTTDENIWWLNNDSELFYNIEMCEHIRLYYIWEWEWFKRYRIWDSDKTIDIYNEQNVSKINDNSYEIPFQWPFRQMHYNLLMIEQSIKSMI
jgi:hypothetical protein